MDQDNEKLFRDAPVWRAIMTLAGTAIAAILVMSLYDITDMFFLGRLNDSAQIAAVSLAGPVFSIFYALAMMLGNGASSLIARAVGSGNREQGRRLASVCIYFSALLGVLLSAFILLFHQELLQLMGAEASTWDYADRYLVIRSLGLVMLLLNTVFSTILGAEGAVIPSFVGNLVSTVVNMVLDPILILFLHMGVAGAAWATVAGNLSGFLYFLYIVLKKANVVNLDIRLAVQNPTLLFGIIALGFPNAVAELLYGFAATFGNRLLIDYSVDAVAGFAAAERATMLIACIPMAIAMGTQSYVAYSIGTGNHKKLHEIVWKTCLLTIVLGLVCTVPCLLFKNLLIQLFLTQASAAAIGESMVIYLMIGSPLLGLYYVSASFLQASGKAALATLVSAVRQGLLLIPMLYLLHALLGCNGVPIAYMVTDLISAGMGLLILISAKIKNGGRRQAAL